MRSEYGRNFISRDADESLRPGRQLRSREFARAARAAAQDSRGEEGRRGRRERVGHRHAAARIPARGRPCERLPLPDRTLRLAGDHQCRLRRGRDDPRTGGADLRSGRVCRPARRSMRESRTARRASCWMFRASARSAGSRGSRCGTESARLTSGMCARKRNGFATGGGGWRERRRPRGRRPPSVARCAREETRIAP